jgi:hypothetical protein
MMASTLPVSAGSALDVVFGTVLIQPIHTTRFISSCAMGQYGFLWQADLKTADAIFRQGLTSRIITAKRAALAMMPAPQD